MASMFKGIRDSFDRMFKPGKALASQLTADPEEVDPVPDVVTRVSCVKVKPAEAVLPQVVEKVDSGKDSVEDEFHVRDFDAPKNIEIDLSNTLDEGYTPEDISQETPLVRIIVDDECYKSEEERVAAIQELLEKDRTVDVNGVTVCGYTPLMLAAARGYTEVIDALISNGANPNGCSEKTGSTALMEAAWHRKIKTVRLLIALRADVNLAMKGGMTALMCAAYQPDNCDMIRELIQAGANPDARTSIIMSGGCWSVVDYAQWSGSRKNMKAFIKSRRLALEKNKDDEGHELFAVATRVKSGR